MMLVSFHLSLEIPDALGFSISKSQAVPPLLRHQLPVFIGISLTSPLKLVAFSFLLLSDRVLMVPEISDALGFGIPKCEAVPPLLRHQLPVFIGISLTGPLELVAFMLFMHPSGLSLGEKLPNPTSIAIPKRKAFTSNRRIFQPGSSPCKTTFMPLFEKCLILLDR